MHSSTCSSTSFPKHVAGRPGSIQAFVATWLSCSHVSCCTHCTFSRALYNLRACVLTYPTLDYLLVYLLLLSLAHGCTCTAHTRSRALSLTSQKERSKPLASTAECCGGRSVDGPQTSIVYVFNRLELANATFGGVLVILQGAFSMGDGAQFWYTQQYRA